MKVLIEVDSSDCRIGAVNDVLDLCRYLRGERVEFLLCGPVTEELRQKAQQAGFCAVIEKKSLPFSRSGLLRYLFEVASWLRLLSTLRPDVVHLNYISWGPSLACAARLAGIPIFARAGGSYSSKNLSSRWISAYLANCEAQAGNLLDSPLRDRVTVVGDLVNMERLQGESAAAKLPSSGMGLPRLIYLGQLVERKGLETLVQALGAMQARAELYLVGGNWEEQGYPERIKRLVAELKLGARVHFVNHRSDALELLKQCDVFVLPSLSEARPRSIIEAMLVGKCVISTLTGGIPTLVQDGVTGILVQPGAAGELARALDTVVSDREARLKLAAAGKRYAKKSFDPVVTARNYLKAYRAAR